MNFKRKERISLMIIFTLIFNMITVINVYAYGFSSTSKYNDLDYIDKYTFKRAASPPVSITVHNITSLDGKVYVLAKYKYAKQNGRFMHRVEAIKQEVDKVTSISYEGNIENYKQKIINCGMNTEMQLWMYDPNEDTWQRKASIPDEYDIFDEVMVSSKGKIFVIGGGKKAHNSDRCNYTAYIRAYDPNTNTWETKSSIPNEMVQGVAASTLPNGKIILTGGTKRGSDNRYVYVYDPQTNQISKKNRINKNYKHDAYAIGQKLYQFSGKGPSNDVGSNVPFITTYKINSDYTLEESNPKYDDCHTYFNATLMYDNNVLLMPHDHAENLYDTMLYYNTYNNTLKKVKGFKENIYDNVKKYAFPMQEDKLNYSEMWKGAPINNGTFFMAGAKAWIIKENNAPKIDSFNTANLVHIGSQMNFTWNAYDPDGESLQYTLKIGNGTGRSDYLNKNLSTKNYSFTIPNNISLSWNSGTNRYEKVLYARLIASDGNKTVQKDTSFKVVNYKPGIYIQDREIIINQGSLQLKGKAWDTNRGTLIIRGNINGQSKAVTINNAPSSQPSSNNFTLTWNLTPGEYKDDITISVTDPYGGYNQTRYTSDILISDVLGEINESLNIIPKNTSDEELLIITRTKNTEIQNTSKNNSSINSIQSKMSNRNVAEDNLFIGEDGSTKSYIKNNLTSYYSLDSGNNEFDIINYVSSDKSINTNTFVIGENLLVDMLFEDIEKDYEGISNSNKIKSNSNLDKVLKKWKNGTLRIKYEHNPNIFDNPAAKHSKGNNSWQTINRLEDSYVIKKAENGMRGEWIMTLKASDNTKKNDFDKYSEDTQIRYIIHEKPNAIIEYSEDSNYIYLSGENSYDKDFEYSLPNNGITKYEWNYLLEDGNWHKLSDESRRVKIPKVVGGKRVTGYSLTVYDCYNASDTTQEKNLVQPKLYSKVYPELSKFNLANPGIPASEKLKVVDIETVPVAMDHIEFSLYQGITRKTNIRTLYNPGDVVANNILSVGWRAIRNYKIPETLKDGNYTAKVKGIKGSTVLENNFTIKVKTPVDLVGRINGVTTNAKIVDENKLLATTSKYVDQVKVNILGKTFDMTLESNENDVKTWKVNFTVDATIGEVNGIAVFTATTPNGNKEIVNVDFQTIIPLDIVGIVEPNPAYAGERVYFTCHTKGHGKKVIVYLWNGDSVVLNPELATTVDNNTWKGSYIVPLKTPDATYPIKAVVERESKSKDTDLSLTIKGNIYELVKPRIRNSN